MVNAGYFISLMDKSGTRTYNKEVMYTLYEFFCGGGMARSGLGKDWMCALANDNDKKKSDIYVKNWGANDLVTADVADLTEDMFKNMLTLFGLHFHARTYPLPVRDQA